MNLFKKLRSIIGPGIITGAADDDPSGIATYTQTGAQFGYGQLWTALFILPMQIAIQEACARIGAVTGKGLIGAIKNRYHKSISYSVVFLLFVANTINIGADIGAMAAATNLILPLNFFLLTILFTVIIISLEVFISYKTYANILKWLTLFLLAYPLTVFIIQVEWWTVLKATFIPHLEFNFQFLFIITGLLGTTISPYLFFWQASQEVEEVREAHLKRLNKPSKITPHFIKLLRIDNFLGMVFSQICTWSIIVVAATVLHNNGITDVKTAADAAKALEPFVTTFTHAGYIAKFIFAIGIIGLGLISVPVLAGSSSYALSETFKWQEGLNLKFRRGKKFYGIIIIGTAIGLFINFVNIDPIKALIYSAVINGIVAVPMTLMIGIIARNENMMGKYKSGFFSTLFVSLTFVCMLISAIVMFIAFAIK